MKRIGKRALILLLALTLTLLSTGCLNAISLDRYGYVLAIGFDRGETLPYRITLMLQNTLSESEDSQTSGGFTLVDAECRNLFEAIETLSGSLPYALDLSRAVLVVIASPLARDAGGIENVLDFAMTRLHIRSNANLFIAVSSAHDALAGLSNELDPNLSRMQINFVTYSQMTGMIPVTNLTLLDETTHTGLYDAVLPLCGVTPEDRKEPARRDSIGLTDYAYVGGALLTNSGMKTGLAGAALLSGSRMVGFLDGQNTQLLLLATGEFEYGRMQLPLPDGTPMSLQLHANKRPRVDFSLQGGARAHVTIPVVAYVELPEHVPNLSDEALASWIGLTLSRRMEQLFAGCQALEADAFGFGKEAVKRFSDTQKWEAYDWKTAYRDMKASFHVVVELSDDSGKSPLE